MRSGGIYNSQVNALNADFGNIQWLGAYINCCAHVLVSVNKTCHNRQGFVTKECFLNDNTEQWFILLLSWTKLLSLVKTKLNLKAPFASDQVNLSTLDGESPLVMLTRRDIRINLPPRKWNRPVAFFSQLNWVLQPQVLHPPDAYWPDFYSLGNYYSPLSPANDLEAGQGFTKQTLLLFRYDS